MLFLQWKVEGEVMVVSLHKQSARFKLLVHTRLCLVSERDRQLHFVTR